MPFLCYANIPNSIDEAAVISMYKFKENSPKILAGIANITLRNSSQNPTEWKSFVPQPFNILEPYLTDNQCISAQTKRFSGYSAEIQKQILQLEDILKRTFIAAFNPEEDVLHFCNRILRECPDVELAEPYYVQQQQAMPNDPLLSKQSVLYTIQAFEAWDIADNGDTILIGVPDSGCNWYHEDLVDAVAINDLEIPDNGIDDDNNGFIDDYYGYNYASREDGGSMYYGDVFNTNNTHGTYVSGIIAARVDNGMGIAGVANKCKIVPIKILAKSGSDYLYCYQSLIYSANRGCKVVNCSWGSPSPYSVVQQSIIDYAIACDVALVAAGGNLVSSVSDSYCTFTPASYYGVLGVGEVNAEDAVSLNHSVLGTACRIMAQGEGNISINGSNQYPSLAWGSSYSTPVVTGIVAALRSHKPELTPIQAIEIVRASAVPIRHKANNNNNLFIPNRANMLNALTFDTENSPCITLQEQHYEDANGNITDRFFPNDTATVVLNIINLLADASNINININPFYALDKSAYTLLDSIVQIQSMKHNEIYPIRIRFITHTPTNIHRVFLMASITATSDINNTLEYADEIKFQLNISDNLTTFQNEKLIVSASDNGYLGRDFISRNLTNGYGFTHKLLGDFLYEGGPMAVADYSKAISTNMDLSTNNNNSFTVIKGLYGNEPNINIIADNNTPSNNNIGITLTTTYSFPSDTSDAMFIKITAKNTSPKAINDFAFGHYYDWDIYSSNYNKTAYFPEAIPANLSTQLAAAEYATDVDESVFIGSLVFADDIPNMHFIPQAAGINYSYNIGGNKTNQIQAFTSGITKQNSQLADIQYIVGLHYTDKLNPNEEINCSICTAIAASKSELAAALINCAKNYTSISDSNDANIFDIYTMAHLLIMNTNIQNARIQIYDATGNIIHTIANVPNTTSFNTNNLPTAAYFVRLYNNNISIVRSIIIKN
jgi:subtilisin family serine protease